jgi:uncharacterized membrane protein
MAFKYKDFYIPDSALLLLYFFFYFANGSTFTRRDSSSLRIIYLILTFIAVILQLVLLRYAFKKNIGALVMYRWLAIVYLFCFGIISVVSWTISIFFIIMFFTGMGIHFHFLIKTAILKKQEIDNKMDSEAFMPLLGGNQVE